MVFEIVREADGGHAVFAQVAFELVTVGEGGREPGCDLRHRAKMDRLCWFGEVSPRSAKEDAAERLERRDSGVESHPERPSGVWGSRLRSAFRAGGWSSCRAQLPEAEHRP